MSDTPRTDQITKVKEMDVNALIELCEQLERELNAALAKLDDARSGYLP